MKEQSETLRVGSPAPAFELVNIAAKPFFALQGAGRKRKGNTSGGNSADESRISLAELLNQGPLILEFLRGTW